MAVFSAAPVGAAAGTRHAHHSQVPLCPRPAGGDQSYPGYAEDGLENKAKQKGVQLERNETRMEQKVEVSVVSMTALVYFLNVILAREQQNVKQKQKL